MEESVDPSEVDSAEEETAAEELVMSANDSSSSSLNLGEFEFNRRLLLNVLAYSVMCVVGAIGNAIVFVAAYRQHVSPENQASFIKRIF